MMQAKVVREIMHLLWSDQPVSQLATQLESLSSLQRHSVLEIVIGLIRNTGASHFCAVETLGGEGYRRATRKQALPCAGCAVQG